MNIPSSSSHRCLVVALLIVAAVSTHGHARVLYVDDDASAGGDGKTWATAFDDLQDALAVAGSGDEMRVAAGSYTPAGPAGSREATFQLISGVAIYGGYGGLAASDPDVRDVAANATTLSGDLRGDDQAADFPHGPTFRDNSFHVVTASGTDRTAVIDGFTITAGNGSSAADPRGGGIRNVSGAPSVANCIFRFNWGSVGGGMYNDSGARPKVINCQFTENSGGAMYNGDNSLPDLDNCSFFANRATSGGAIYNTTSSSAILDNCVFDSNVASSTDTYAGGGGAIYIVGGSDAILTNCIFSMNIALNARGGAMVIGGGSKPVLLGCEFLGNTAKREGGAIFNISADPVIADCDFVSNSAERFGGGVYSFTGDPMLSRCVFAGNSASGGGSGGGVFVQAGSLPMLTDCAFTGNVAAFNGGGLFTNDRAVLNNCTFAGNRAGTSGAGGGIAVFAGASPALTSCILWGNSDGGGTDESGQIHVGDGAPTVTYSCVQGLDTFAGSGNIGEDPRFVDADGPDGVVGTTDDDLRLRPDSPAIDTGDPAFVAEAGAKDLDGHARVLCDRVDMGAYEFGIGDADCDRDVDLDDYLLWTMCMLGPAGGPYVPGCEVFDIDLDGHVDLGDFAGFQRIFGQ